MIFVGNTPGKNLNKRPTSIDEIRSATAVIGYHDDEGIARFLWEWFRLGSGCVLIQSVSEWLLIP